MSQQKPRWYDACTERPANAMYCWVYINDTAYGCYLTVAYYSPGLGWVRERLDQALKDVVYWTPVPIPDLPWQVTLSGQAPHKVRGGKG